MTDAKDKQLQMRVDDDFLSRIDEWRRRQPAIPSRAQAIRQLVAWGLHYASELALNEREEAKREKRRASRSPKSS